VSVGATVRVRLNGEEREIAAGLTIRSLLELLELHPALVVVEHNRAILDRETYPDVRIAEGDNIELVHFVGGG
jgi:thiamine biosynthesis protein ThiS